MYFETMTLSTEDKDKWIIFGGPDPVNLLHDGSLGEMIIKELKLRPANIGLVSMSNIDLHHQSMQFRLTR